MKSTFGLHRDAGHGAAIEPECEFSATGARLVAGSVDDRVKILSTTICYPTPTQPNQGLFVQRRLEALARLADVRVVCPVPTFPGFTEPVDADARIGSLSVSYPPMHYLPGVLKTLDASWFARALSREVVRVRREFPFDLLDAHFVWPDGVGAWRVASRLRAPMVITVRGKIVTQARPVVRRRMIASMLRDVDARIAVSSALAVNVRELIGEAHPVHVIPNGVDTDVFRPMDRNAARRELGWQVDAKYVVSVGQVREIKGFDRLVAVWPEVRRRAGDARLVLVGPSIGERAYERRLWDLVRRHELDGIVTHVGRQEPGQIARMLAAADAFALATRSEGWCNAIHEALAVGTPVVATDVGGNREQITDGRLGLLVPCGDAAALAGALVAALERTWDREAIASIGGGRSWHQAAAETLAVFEDVLARRRAGRRRDA